VEVVVERTQTNKEVIQVRGLHVRETEIP